VKGEDHPFQITCSATSGTCTPTSVFISAANISAIEIKGIPADTNTRQQRAETIVAKMSYQRWFVDMGGFITFVSAADQELVTEDAGSGNLRVAKKRRKDKVVPGTGIVRPATAVPSRKARIGMPSAHTYR